MHPRGNGRTVYLNRHVYQRIAAILIDEGLIGQGKMKFFIGKSLTIGEGGLQQRGIVLVAHLDDKTVGLRHGPDLVRCRHVQAEWWIVWGNGDIVVAGGAHEGEGVGIKAQPRGQCRPILQGGGKSQSIVRIGIKKSRGGPLRCLGNLIEKQLVLCRRLIRNGVDPFGWRIGWDHHDEKVVGNGGHFLIGGRDPNRPHKPHILLLRCAMQREGGRIKMQPCGQYRPILQHHAVLQAITDILVLKEAGGIPHKGAALGGPLVGGGAL